jgi:dTDP-4-dehydrorhamnose 3,5-epimerase
MKIPTEFTSGPIEGVVITELRRFADQRGWLTEVFRHDALDEAAYPAMGYVSMTYPGVARGPHEHVDQTDLFAFVGPGAFKVYLWDTRGDSPTFGARQTLIAGADAPMTVLVPPGVVHAYRNVSDENGLVFNAPNRLYAGWGKQEPVDEIRHEDRPDQVFALD